MQVNFNIDQLIHDLGGPRAVADLMRKVGYDGITASGIHKWTKRNRVFSDQLAYVLWAAAAAGKPVDVYRYLTLAVPPPSCRQR